MNSTVEGNLLLYQVATGITRNAERDIQMKTVSIDPSVLHIVENLLGHGACRQLTLKKLLSEITRENLISILENTQVDDIVVVNIFYR